MTARQHHFVPQCYLKGFAKPRSKDGRLLVTDLARWKSYPATPRKIAKQRDFNRVDIPGIAPDAIETALSSFETTVDGALFRTIEAENFVNDGDRRIILNLMALLHVRNPRFREARRRFQDELSKMLLQAHVRSPEQWQAQIDRMTKAGYPKPELPYEEIRDYVRRGEFDLNVSTTQHVKVELQAFETVLTALADRNWALWRAAPGSGGYITTDHPVCLVWTDAEMAHKRLPVGLAHRRTQVLFPLSKGLLMTGVREEFREGVYGAPQHLVAMANSILIGFAEDQIYSADDQYMHLSGPTDELLRGAELLKAYDRLWSDMNPTTPA